jgi:pyruvate-formate lyase
MTMNERITKLRTQTLEAKPTISAERARLVTEFYKRPETRGLSTPMQHALAFKHIMENKRIVFNDGELIVGERGPAPKATPTYPEVCIHSVQDLQYLNDRKKTARRRAGFTPRRSSPSGRAARRGTASSPR